MSNGRIQIIRTMRGLVEECRDSSGEVCMTKLAEMACQDMNGYEGDDIPEIFFECSYEVFERLATMGQLCADVGGIINGRDSSWF